VEARSELTTNDPEMPLIKLAVTAEVKPVPASVRRIENADLTNGESVATFKVWPTAHPRITLHEGETLAFSVRIWPGAATSSQSASSAQGAGSLPVEDLPSLPSSALSVGFRRDNANQTWWLDVKVGPMDAPGSFRSLLVPPPEPVDLRPPLLDVTVVVMPAG
jgi:hypothetical protein